MFGWIERVYHMISRIVPDFMHIWFCLSWWLMPFGNHNDALTRKKKKTAGKKQNEHKSLYVMEPQNIISYLWLDECWHKSASKRIFCGRVSNHHKLILAISLSLCHVGLYCSIAISILFFFLWHCEIMYSVCGWLCERKRLFRIMVWKLTTC